MSFEKYINKYNTTLTRYGADMSKKCCLCEKIIKGQAFIHTKNILKGNVDKYLICGKCKDAIDEKEIVATNGEGLRTDQLSFLVGSMIGQMSELLNSIKRVPMTNEMIYRALFDIHQSAALQIHELYYKGNKSNEK